MANLDIQKTEEKILKFWRDRQIFEKTLEKRRGSKRFVFYEGPPTANAKPAIHHFIGRVYKDLFVRYKTMRGYFVPRRAGWDTQGIPVELEVEKKLGFKSKTDIEAYGVAKFNKKAKESVWQYRQDWEQFTERIGYWLDMSDPYVTYENDYLESLWWLFKEFDKKDLLYEGYKVLPWCTRCGTSLSSHEVAQGYQDVTEPSVYVKFKIKSKAKEWANTSILSWTTTPWTLPGNLALAVGKEIEYALVEFEDSNLVLANGLVAKVLGDDAKIIRVFKGSDLLGLQYEPLFKIVAFKDDKPYKIYPADFVTTEDGTGVVHTAVMYGEDDYKLGQEIGLPMKHTVNEEGFFTDDVPFMKGKRVKESDGEIIEYLKKKNLLLKVENYTHSYPFCWRCKTPLLYYARNSWFLAISKVKEKLGQNNQAINWYPSHMKDGRFGEFIKEGRDWAISRERYWGTPLPIWRCNECKATRVIGSLVELAEHGLGSGNAYYLIRHGGSTKNNIEKEGLGIISSKLKNDTYVLTEPGKLEALATAKKLKKIGIDLILYSPMKRTSETAQIIASELNVKNIKVDKKLVELDHGSKCEGQTHFVCVPEGMTPDLDYVYGDGESWRKVKNRMVSVIHKLESKYTDKKIAIVSHGDPLWMLNAALLGLSDEQTLAQRKKLYLSVGAHKKMSAPTFPFNEEGDLDLHRPFIDEVAIKCGQCEGKMSRVSEVADVWFDSGGMPFAQWHYPFENDKDFKNNFPADFICEGVDQTRGWFYSMLAVATMLGKPAPYRNVISYGHVLDDKGKKMSKSVGNVVVPDEVFAKYGVDATRWYFYTVNEPGDYKLFNERDVKAILNNFVTTLYSALRFFELYKYHGIEHEKTEIKPINVLDRWILSRLNRTIEESTERLDDYDFLKASRGIEKFIMEDLSNWWIRRSRSRFQKGSDGEGSKAALLLLRHLLVETTKLIAPFMPLVADSIYKELTNKLESVHLDEWPKADKKFISDELEQDMVLVRELATRGLALRMGANIKVRQPLNALVLKDQINSELAVYLEEEINVKHIFTNPAQEEPVILDTKITKDLKYEGLARELTRQIQSMRKEAGYKVADKVKCWWDSQAKEISVAVKLYEEKIMRDAFLASLGTGIDDKKEHDVLKEVKLDDSNLVRIAIAK